MLKQFLMNMPAQNINTTNQITDRQNEIKDIEIEYVFLPPKEIMEILNLKKSLTHSNINLNIDNDENTAFKIIFSNYYNLLSEKNQKKGQDTPDFNKKVISLIKKKSEEESNKLFEVTLE